MEDKTASIIDPQGYRANVGFILLSDDDRVFWAKRVGKDAWQFPQGGLHQNETPEQCLFRELREEIGLLENEVTILGHTRQWLRYRIPHRIQRHSYPPCIGQKQRWYLLRLQADPAQICFDVTEKPEFEAWRWVNFWYPLRQVVSFKREVYRRALRELAPFVTGVSKLKFLPLNHILEN